MITKIQWMLNGFCTAQCSYCPTRYWGGPEPRGILEYVDVAQKFIDHYSVKLGRKIHWVFTGGEPLDMFDFPMLLKQCKDAGGNIELHTNGGKLWMDWWAIEPHVDQLNLTVHYWQNPKLVKFITSTFKNKNKPFKVSSPIRPEQFEQDMSRVAELEQECEITIERALLARDADFNMGLINYTDEQLSTIKGSEWLEEHKKTKDNLFHENVMARFEKAPKYPGALCNVGVEVVKINPEGRAAGGDCNTAHLGFIWGELNLPDGPQHCKMQACMSPEDQLITKFI